MFIVPLLFYEYIFNVLLLKDITGLASDVLASA